MKAWALVGKRFIAVDRASHKDGALVGEWSNDLGPKGSWHGKRVAQGGR
jgi:hypothetical protein